MTAHDSRRTRRHTVSRLAGRVLGRESGELTRLVGAVGLLLPLAAGVLLLPDPAVAYGGPASGSTDLGVLLATLATVGVTLAGFLWFPLKRLVGTISVEEEEEEDATDR